MRYVMTGATGFVGGALAARLRRDGHAVTALVRDPARAAALREAGVDLALGDLADGRALREALAGADGLFHVAGWYRVGVRSGRRGDADRREAYAVNVEGTRTALTAAGEAGVPRVVYTSTLAVNSDTRGRIVDESYRFTGRHISVYDETKAAAHDVAEEMARAGLPVVTVMPGLVYGPGDTSQAGRLLADLLARRPVVLPAAGRLCWAYVDDIVDGHVRAMERGRPGEAYLLAGPPHGLAEGLAAAAEQAGVRRPLVVPGRAVAAAAGPARLLERLPVPATYTGEALRVSVATYLGSPAKAQRDLGWSARPLAEGLPPTIIGTLPSLGAR